MGIKLELKNYRNYQDSNPLRIELEKGFTSFVGLNNSGKSNILKFFYEFRPFFTLYSNFGVHWIHALKGIASLNVNVPDPDQVFNNGNNRNIIILIEFEDQNRLDHNTPNKIKLIAKPDTKHIQIILYKNSDTLTIPDIPENRFNGSKGVLSFPAGHINFNPVYDAFMKLSNTMYIASFRNALNMHSDQNYYDIQVGKQFILQWKSLKHGSSTINNKKTLTLKNEIKNIFEFIDLEIDSTQDDTNIHLFINGESYLLNEVGSGIAQFIIVLINVAIRNPDYILIDEPELGLHPTLQLDFLTTLGSYAKEGVLYTTHSIGLARASSNRIYSVQKKDQNTSILQIYEETTNINQFLGELSFSGYSDLGYESILLVEGPTEVLTVQQFLRLLKKDHKVLILPLGGSSMINGTKSTNTVLTDLKRTSSKIFVIIDSEKESDESILAKDRQNFIKICKDNKIKSLVLERRAIENYLKDQAIKEVKGPNYKSLDKFEKLESINPSWGKSENWKIARKMLLEDIIETDLGEFLKKIVV